VRLRVFNDAQVKAGILTWAMNRVDDVYSQIRIRTRWTAADPVTDDGMPLFDIAITNNDVPQSGTRPDRPSVNPSLGQAYSTAHRAYAYYGRIEDAAFAGRSFTADVLADVISHELGHLLLADSHSPVGIMRFDMLVKPGRRSRFDSREGNAIRQRVFAGGIGRRVINLEPCGSPLTRKCRGDCEWEGQSPVDADRNCAYRRRVARPCYADDAHLQKSLEGISEWIA